MIEGSKYVDLHHLVPKCKKGKDVVELHRICHNMIHATFTEIELEKHYHTIPRLLENETIKKFVEWVSKKEPDFYEKTRDTRKLRVKRKK